MNFSNEVNVKNFHVLDNNHVAVAKKSANGEVYFLVKKSSSTDADTLFATDKFRLSDIKYARVSKPSVPEFKKWTLTMPTADDIGGIAPGSMFTVYMHFTNLYGYGITDRWEKYATVVLKKSWVSTDADGNVAGWASDGQKKFAAALAEQINAQYVAKDMKPIEAKVATNGETISIEDITYEQQKNHLNRRALEMHMEPSPIEMFITTNILENADESWCKEVREKAELHEQYKGEADTDKELKNGYKIWQMEKVSALNMYDTLFDPCSGYIGYDTVMDNKTLDEDYYVLDIHYETVPKAGMPANRNLKDLSFACTEENTLNALCQALNNSGNTGTGAGDPVALATAGGGE